MRKLIAAVITASALVGATPALATESPAPEPSAAAPQVVAPTPSAKRDPGERDDPNRLVCTRERVIGSNMPQKVCMTVAERERLRDAAEARSRNTRGQDYNTTIGGPGR